MLACDNPGRVVTGGVVAKSVAVMLKALLNFSVSSRRDYR
jgi:hypothetical protein